MNELTAEDVAAGSETRWYCGWFLPLLVLIHALSLVDRTIIAVASQAMKVDLNLGSCNRGLLDRLALSIF